MGKSRKRENKIKKQQREKKKHGMAKTEENK